MFVYCAKSWRISTAITTFTIPLTCPPITSETIDISAMERERLIYLRLHGMPDQPYLYGDNLLTALSAVQVQGANLTGSLVFLEGCYGAMMADAFLKAGALAVVGSSEKTYGRKWFLGPSSKIGFTWLSAIRSGATVLDALALASDSQDWQILGDKGAKLT